MIRLPQLSSRQPAGAVVTSQTTSGGGANLAVP
jgi:hypothetical protein